MRGRGDRLEALLAERELDRLLVTDLTNVRYLTGFTGTNGACVCGPGIAPLLHRLPLHRARRRPRSRAGSRSRSAATGSAAIAERLEGKVGFEDDQMSVRMLAKLKEKLADGVEAGRRRRPGRAAAPGQGRRGAGGDRRRLGAGRRGLALERSSAASPGAPSATSPSPPKRGSASSAASPRSRRSSPPAPTAPCRTPSPASARSAAASWSSSTWAPSSTATAPTAPAPSPPASPARRRARSTRSCSRAQLAALEAIEAGVDGEAVDAVARKLIDEAGHGERFGHGLGHGVGLEVHEGPRLSLRSDDVLGPGEVVTVEPGDLPARQARGADRGPGRRHRGRLRNLSGLPKGAAARRVAALSG